MFANANEIFECMLSEVLDRHSLTLAQMDVMVFRLAKRLNIHPARAAALVGDMLWVGMEGQKPS